MLDSLLSPHELPKRFSQHRVYSLHALAPGKSVTLADIEGAGCIRRLFLTMQPKRLREMVLRLYWDGEKTPSVECPVSDFFGIGHDHVTAPFKSLLFYVAPRYGYNCYIPMPFSNSARITLTNQGTKETIAGINFKIGYQMYREPLNVPYRFHAVWRRVMPAYRRGAPFTLLEAKGAGKVIGVIYHVCKRDWDDRWSHGGGDQFFIDGDTAEPTYLYGIGGEDFAHHAWGLATGDGPYSGAHFVHPEPGIKQAEGASAFEPHGWEQHDGGKYSMYRFFIPDPTEFRSSIRLVFGTAANEISATTYWYQNEPHASFSKLPPIEKRAFCSRLTEEETWSPLRIGQDIPIAVLGPTTDKRTRPWWPDRKLDLKKPYKTDVRQPYGDVIRPPYPMRWRRSNIRGGFIDLAAIHRPKSGLRARGLWNYRSLPLGVLSHQLVRVRATRPRKLVLRVGLEDRLWVWHNGRSVATLHIKEPKAWALRDVKLKLGTGWQDIVFTASQDRWARWSAWAVYARFLEEDGKIAEGLQFDSFAKLDPTPERWRELWPPEEPIPCDDYRDPLALV